MPSPAHAPDTNRRKSPLPAIAVAIVLILLAGLLYVMFGRTKPETPPAPTKTVASVALAPAPDSAPIAAPTHLADPTPAPSPTPENPPLDPRLVGPFTLTGRVLDVETRQPIDGVKITRRSRLADPDAGWHRQTPRPPDPGPEVSTTSDTEGRYALSVPTAEYLHQYAPDDLSVITLDATKKGYLLIPMGDVPKSCDLQHVFIKDRSRPTEQNILMVSSTTISGTVSFLDGRPAHGTVARFKSFRPGELPLIRLNPSGSYLINVPTFHVTRLEFDLAGYGALLTRDIVVADTPLTNVDFVVEGPGSASGFVYDPDGAPAANATIRILCVFMGESPEYPERWTSDTNGSFKIDQIPPGNYRIWAESSGFADSSLPLSGFEGNLSIASGQHTEGIELHLRRPFFIGGRMITTTSLPVTGAKLRLREMKGGDVRDPVMTDSEGRFRFSDLDDDSHLVLICSPKETDTGLLETQWGSFSNELIPNVQKDYVVNSNKDQVSEAQSDEIISILVSVLDATTKVPIPDFKVVSADPKYPTPEVEDSALGIFRVETPRSGKVEFVGRNSSFAKEPIRYLVSAPGFIESVFYVDGHYELTESQTLVVDEVYLKKIGSIVGRVIDKQTRGPIADEDVFLSRLGRDSLSRRRPSNTMTATTDGDGKYSFENVQPGDYWIQVYPEAPFAPTELACELVSSDLAMPDIELEKAIDTLSVTLVASDGGSAADHWVHLYYNDATGYGDASRFGSGQLLARSKTDPIGTATFSNLRQWSLDGSGAKLTVLGENFYVGLTPAAVRESNVRIPLGNASAQVLVTRGGQPIESLGSKDLDVSMELSIPGAHLSPLSASWTKEDNGSFLARGLPPGYWRFGIDSWYLKTTFRNQRDVPSQEVECINGQMAVVVFRLDAGTINGRVVTEEGTPVGDALIACDADSGWGTLTRSRDDGGFQIEQLQAGTYSLSADAGNIGTGQASGVRLETDGESLPVTIVLKPTARGTLRSMALDASTGAPLQRARLRLHYQSGGAPVEINSYRTASGILVEDGIPVGTYVCEVSLDGYETDRQTITLSAEQTITEVVSKLKPLP